MLLNIRRYHFGSPENEPAVIIGAGNLNLDFNRTWHLLVGEDEESLRPLCGEAIDLDRSSIQANTFTPSGVAANTYPKRYFSFDGACPRCKEAAKNGS